MLFLASTWSTFSSPVCPSAHFQSCRHFWKTVENPRTPSINMNRSVSTFPHAVQCFYLPNFLIIPTGSGPMGCLMFFNRNARCDSGIRVANIFMVEVCQEHTTEDTLVNGVVPPVRCDAFL